MSVGPSGLALGLTLDVVVPVATASSSSVLTESDVQRLIAMYKDDYARCWVDTFATVDDRFPGLAASNGGGGKVMVDFLLAVFQDHAVKLLQYFHEGERMLFRSAINDRNEESSRIEYKNRILQRGMNSHGRSKAVSIKNKMHLSKAIDHVLEIYWLQLTQLKHSTLRMRMLLTMCRSGRQLHLAWRLLNFTKTLPKTCSDSLFLR